MVRQGWDRYSKENYYGKSFDETSQMIEEVTNSDVQTPILMGGGVNAENVALALHIADGVIVSSNLKKVGGFTRESMLMDWDLEKMKAFMNAVEDL